MASTATEAAPLDGNVVQLFAMSAAMFVGAFAAGYFPMLLNLSSDKLRIVTLLGAGLLIGTALVVIIPEGMHMWLAATASHEHDAPTSTEAVEHDHHDEESQHEHHHEHQEHWQIGASMAAGFAFMLLVDKLSGGHHGHSHNSTELPSSSSSKESTSSSNSNSNSSSSTSAFIGLVIHAAVDGVALGATCFSGGTEASLLIFVAIMLHKAPAAFGLTVYLNQTGEKSRAVRRQLLLFSLAAPVGAILTFYCMGMGMVSYQMSTVALVMLFSGGTFLFVATMHILPEVLHQEPLTWEQAAVLVVGIVFPILINFEHGH
eukprot:m.33728 g.33728  ORF g.33728 m.33728 type:complete len:317 (+) comp12254_c0_seq1:126-1076(+)